MFRVKYLAVALAVSSGSVMAAADFEGFYGQLGAGYESFSTSSATGNIGAGYMHKFGDKFMLGAGVEYSPFSGSYTDGYITSWNSRTGYGPSAKTRLQKDSSSSIFLIPATPVGDDGLLYGKVGYSMAQFSQPGYSVTADGYLLGVGYKHQINNGLYGFFESNFSNYEDINTSLVSPVGNSTNFVYGKFSNVSSYNFIAGIGYKF